VFHNGEGLHFNNKQESEECSNSSNNKSNQFAIQEYAHFMQMMMGSTLMLKPTKTKKCKVTMDISDISSDKESNMYMCNILGNMSIYHILSLQRRIDMRIMSIG
jgi:hypothetical protein